MNSTENLAALVADGWQQHAAQPAAVAARLLGAAAQLPADADGAGAIALAQHVWLVHLDDPAGLESFLQALPAAVAAADDSGALLRRVRWLLATLADAPADPVPDAARWRALQDLWTVWIRRGRAAEVLALLDTELAAALAHDDAAARRALGSSCNNLAVELRCGSRGDATVDALMMGLARASRALWVSAGGWVQQERADYQLARCHAVLGEGAAAVAHAQACLAAVQAHAGAPEADAFEHFFAYEALAWAHRAAADDGGAAQARTQMVALLAQVPAADQVWCSEALAEFDAAAG